MVWECVSTASRLFWRHLGMLVMANILWLLLSVPIVTWPAATAGLFTSFAAWSRKSSTRLIRMPTSEISGMGSDSIGCGAACCRSSTWSVWA